MLNHNSILIKTEFIFKKKKKFKKNTDKNQKTTPSKKELRDLPELMIKDLLK